MTQRILFSFPQHLALADDLLKRSVMELGQADLREFPDGESYIRIDSDVKGKTVILLCALNNPNAKILPLMFMAQTLKEFGAKKICLVAPYLPYMRQDKRFHDGEVVTAFLFSRFLSGWIDGLITIDPHLHRILHLSDIYTVPTLTLHATETIAAWIGTHIESPFLIGPDEESRQWIAEIAAYAKLPFVIGAKQRYGDRNVSISLSDTRHMGLVPVLVDDVISTGASMAETLRLLQARGFSHPVCIGVHALFDAKAEASLRLAGADNIISCNTVCHSTNKIDISPLVMKGIESLCPEMI